MKFFKNEKTEKAADLLYSQYDRKTFQEVERLLKEAVNEGDADAYYFLSRCYLGPEFIWKYAGFEVDEKKSIDYLRESVIRGSAIGVIGANRISQLDQELIEAMPFDSLKEARDAVLKMAEAGQAFCQFLIGHIYYWEDVYEIDNLPHPLFNNQAFEAWGAKKNEKMDELEAEINRTAVYWYEKAIDSGLIWGADNLLNMYKKGRIGVPENKERREQIIHKLMSAGNPYYAESMADIYYSDNRFEEALELYIRAADGGQLSANSMIGFLYEKGKGTEKDIFKAINHYTIAADDGMGYAQNNLALIYSENESVQDYDRAVYYFKKAVENGNKYAITNLGDLYLKGLGVEQDYTKARELLEQGQNNNRRRNGLGQIYAYGLGVPENIAKGMEYFKQANDDDAKQHMTYFKKGLFGGWKRK